MRRDDAIYLGRELGPKTLTIVDARNGWPALASVQTSAGATPVSLHVGPIGLSHRGRDDVERRFQNPGTNKPVEVLPGTIPLLIGFIREGDVLVLVAMDAPSRVGDMTRVSLFVPLAVVAGAAASGWVEHFSDSGERILAFRSELLPIYVDLVQNMVDISPAEIQTILTASGLGPGADLPAEERRRRATTQLIRDARFSRDVCKSYGGLCAMCGLNHSLVVGAHVYPASAPGSQDEVWNGIALCQNHHFAFDAHKIFVDPATRKIRLHPELHAGAARNPACKAFVELTFESLTEPTGSSDRPRAQVFKMRYEYFDSKYSWNL